MPAALQRRQRIFAIFTVTVKKVEVPEAKKLILALPEGMIEEGTKLYFGEREIEILKRHIFK